MTAERTPRRVGPYRILKRLGLGGMGVVYEAMHQDTAERVALKTVRVADAALLGSIRREIHALSCLDHPGIARILAQGVHKGVPWYAMRLFEGTTLADHIRAFLPSSIGSPEDASWWTTSIGQVAPRVTEILPVSGPSSPQEAETGSIAPRVIAAGGALHAALTLVRRLCHPLRYLHGEGMVHRDLKPANILVKADGTPVIIDFGLTSRFSGEASRDTAEAGATASGTVGYMAPEQIRGEMVDARADLYALGCFQYELVTGRRVFQSDHPASEFRGHLTMAPTPLSEVADGVPKELEELVLRLLEKEPRERLGYADDVARVLAEAGASNGAFASASKGRTHLYRPGLAGRQDEMAKLTGMLDRLTQGQAGITLISGESGVGKSRLLTELARIALGRKVQVLMGSCPLNPGPLAGLRPVLQVIRDRCLEKGASEVERLLGRRGKVLARYEPSLCDIKALESYPEPEELPEEAGRIRLLSYIVETLAAVSEDGPVLLVIDDAQWADDLTLGVVAQVERAIRVLGVRISVVVTCRSEEPREELAELGKQEGVEAWDLGRLGADEVGAIVRDMLALPEVPPIFAAFLNRESEGNAFFVAEYLRTAAEAGVLRRDESGVWQVGEEEGVMTEEAYQRLPMPRSIRDLVLTHVSGLSEPEQRLLQAAAVYERESPIGVASKVAELGEEETLAAVQGLERRHLVEEAGGVIRFAHDKLREVVYASLDEGRRRLLHGRTAEVLDALPEGERQRALGALGWHWEQAGDRARARGQYVAVARSARKSHALREAEKAYRSYYRVLDQPNEESIRERLDFSRRVLGSLGLATEEERETRLALDEARALGLVALAGEAKIALGRLLLVRGESRALEETLQEATTTGDPKLEGHARMALAGFHGYAETLQDYQLAVDAYRRAGDSAGVAEALAGVAIMLTSLGRLEEADALASEALRGLQLGSDRERECLYLGVGLSYLRSQQGRTDEANRLTTEALALARAQGFRRMETSIGGYLATLRRQEGNFDDAIHLLEGAIAACRDAGDKSMELGNWAQLGQTMTQAGRLPESRPALEQAIAIARLVGSRDGESELQMELARLALLLGEREAVRASIEEAARLAAGFPRCAASLLCVRGHDSLERGESAQRFLAETRGHVHRGTALLGPKAQLDFEISPAALERAQRAWERCAPLVCGFAPEDLTAGQLRWLREHRPEAIPPAVMARLDEDGTPRPEQAEGPRS